MRSKRFHNIVDLGNCNQNIADPEAILKFIGMLAKEINMTILAGPIASEGIPENPGYSALAIVDFSHISIHTFTKYSEALIDVFSCKEYDREKVLKLCQSFFANEKTNIRQKEVWWGE